MKISFILCAGLLACFVPKAVHAQSWTLVETVGDPDKKSRTDTNTAQTQPYTDTYSFAVGSYSYDSQRPDGKHFQASVSFEAPPSKLDAGQEFTVTATGKASDNPQSPSGGGAGLNYSTEGLIELSKEGEGAVGRWSDGSFHASGKRTYKFKVPPDAPEKFVITAGGTGVGTATAWHYQKGATAPPPTPTPTPSPSPAEEEAHLAAYLEPATLEVVPDQNGQSARLIISGWKRNTSRPVEVSFPRQSDGFGSQDGQGVTGIVVPLGQGAQDVANMSGARGPDGSYGKFYQWSVFVRARSTAKAGTVPIPIVVQQEGAGKVQVTLNVRVLPGRTKQSGGRDDGEGVPTGGTGGGGPPVTADASATGLSARLETGTLPLVPGTTGLSTILYIKGFRTNTSDQVKIFFPQEGQRNGNLGNDLVAFPGSTALDPANMATGNNGEYPFNILFRAMERAPSLTTGIDIIVSQNGHQPVRLVVVLAVNGGSGGPQATPPPPPPPPPLGGGGGPVHRPPPGGGGGKILPAFGADQGAALTDRAAHLTWAKAHNYQELADNLDMKLNRLFQCPGFDEEQASKVFATISVIIAKAMPDAKVYGGDALVIGTDWEAHRRAFAGRPQRIGVLLDNARWKTGLTVKALDQRSQPEFFADVSVALAEGAILPK